MTLISRFYQLCVDRNRAIFGAYVVGVALNFGWTMWFFREFADNLLAEVIVTLLAATLWPLYWAGWMILAVTN